MINYNITPHMLVGYQGVVYRVQSTYDDGDVDLCTLDGAWGRTVPGSELELSKGRSVYV